MKTNIFNLKKSAHENCCTSFKKSTAKSKGLISLVLFLFLFCFTGIDSFAQIVIDGDPSDWPAVLNTPNVQKTFKHDPFNQLHIDDQWTQGSQDNDASPSLNWHWVYGNSNDKGDIGNVGSVILGNKIYFFGDRYAQNGTCEIGFWFFVGAVGPIGDGSNQSSKSSFTGEHSNGDLLILSDFTNGGKNAVGKVFQWQGKTASSPGGLVEIAKDLVDAQMAVSAGTYNVPTYPGWSYSPKFGEDTSYPKNAFFEGSLDLSKFPGGNTCFKGILCETRNSHQEFNASLQDLVAAPFTIVTSKLTCPEGVTLSCKSQNDINAEFIKWLALFKKDGGINPVITFSPANPTAPLACGGSITVTATLRDACSATEQSCSSTFAVTPAPAASLTGIDYSATACDFKDLPTLAKAFADWLASIKPTGGCDPKVVCVTPAICPERCGGKISLTFKLTDICGEPQTFIRTFEIKSVKPDIDAPANFSDSSCKFTDQADLDAKFAAYLKLFQAKAGCDVKMSCGTVAAPNLCTGGTTTVTFTATDLCLQTATVTRTFSITRPETAASLTGTDYSANACDFKDLPTLAKAFADWLISIKATGGCNPKVVCVTPAICPERCGGKISLTFKLTDICGEPQTFIRTFEIKSVKPDIDAPANFSDSSCKFTDQADLDAKFAAYLKLFQAKAGCDVKMSCGTVAAPNLCTGGTTTVTFTATDLCLQTATVTRTFSITRPETAASLTGTDYSANACDFKDLPTLAKAFADWLASIKPTGGCDPKVVCVTPAICPERCGGKISLTFKLTDICGEPQTFIRTFEIKSVKPDIDAPANFSDSSCKFTDQADLDAKFAAYLKLFQAKAGCDVKMSCGTIAAPNLCTGGTTTVTFTATDLCLQTATVTRTFSITRPETAASLTGTDYSANACDFKDLPTLAKAFADWLASIKPTGGCNPKVVCVTPAICPERCGGKISLTFKLTDICGEPQTFIRTFEIKSVKPDIDAPANFSDSSCKFTDQADLDAKFAAYLKLFQAKAGCDVKMSCGTVAAPNLCTGGTTTVTFTATDLCLQTATVTRTFSITRPETAASLTGTDYSANACDFKDLPTLAKAFADWLISIKATGGCNPKVVCVTPAICPERCGGKISLTFKLTDICGEPQTFIRTFEIKSVKPDIDAPANFSDSSCKFTDQADLDAKFEAYLKLFQAKAGCDVKMSCGTVAAPNLCTGGTTTVTFTATDLCLQTATVTRTFSITRPETAASLTGTDYSANACDFKDLPTLAKAFADWLASIKPTGGCDPKVVCVTPAICPERCGGKISLTFKLTDICGEPQTFIRTFEIKSVKPDIDAPANFSDSSCKFTDQADLDAKFAAYLKLFQAKAGCDVKMSCGTIAAPNLCTGGTTTVTFTATDLCLQTATVTRTFSITRPETAASLTGTDYSANACDFKDLPTLAKAFADWLASIKPTGGCNPKVVCVTPAICPERCGGKISLTFKLTDICGEPQTFIRTFEIKSVKPDIDAPANFSDSSCKFTDQADLDTKFAAYLKLFQAKAGCDVKMSCGTVAAPNLCTGGTTTVTFTATDLCLQTATVTRTFSITRPETAASLTGTDYSANACDFKDLPTLAKAFADWLISIKATGGCNPKVVCVTPAICPERCGGKISLTFKLTDICGEPQTFIRTFEIKSVKPDIDAPANFSDSSCKFTDQADLDAKFEAYLKLFQAKAGCDVKMSCGTVAAPNLCTGGTTTVTFTATDLCLQTATVTRTFSITRPETAASLTGTDYSANACDFKDLPTLAKAFADWLASIKPTGGCDPKVVCVTPAICPERCGGKISLTFKLTDICGEPQTFIRTFEIKSVKPDIDAPANFSDSSCKFTDQADLDAKFAAYLKLFQAKAGCDVKMSCGTVAAPNLCTGGTTTVTFTATDLCLQTATVTRTFSITRPETAASLTGTDYSANACDFKDLPTLAKAFADWLASIKPTGGCNPKVVCVTPAICPERCGGKISLTFKLTDICGGTQTFIRTFEIKSAKPEITAPANFSASSCTFANQAAVDARFADYLKEFIATGGCDVKMSCGTVVAPNLCGGITTVTFTVTDLCHQTSTITRTFAITKPEKAVAVNAVNKTFKACYFADLPSLTKAFADWLASFTVSGGCNPKIECITPAICPERCGGKISLTFKVTDRCYETQTFTRSFEITPAKPEITAPANFSASSCTFANQAAVDARFADYLKEFKADGGCDVKMSCGTVVAPNFCGGGITTVTFTVTDLCHQTSTITRTFAITKPERADITGADLTLKACDFAGQSAVNKAFADWLGTIKAIGGCNSKVECISEATAPSACGGKSILTFKLNDGCTGSKTVTRTFEIIAPPVINFTCGDDVTIQSGCTTTQLSAAWAAFIASTKASGGCNGVLTNNAPANPPSVCGGSVSVTWTYKVGVCGQQSGCSSGNTMTCTKRFTVVGSGDVDVKGPDSVSLDGCKFTCQADVDKAFNNWLAQFTAVKSAGATASFSGDPRVAPRLDCGGAVTVTYSIAGKCNNDNVSATFTLTKCSDGPNLANAEFDPAIKFDVHVFPNPFSENVNLKFTTPSSDKVNIAIYDITGKLIENHVIMPDQTTELKFGNMYQSGIYILNFTQGREVKTIRVIKK